MKISPSYIQLLSHFTIQTHDAKSAMKPNIGSILVVTVYRAVTVKKGKLKWKVDICSKNWIGVVAGAGGSFLKKV